MSRKVFLVLFALGGLYVIVSALVIGVPGGIPATARAATLHYTATSTEWNLRIDGAADGDWLGYSYPVIADLNGNGKNDLLLQSWFADNNGRDGSGSFWVIYDSILDGYTGISSTTDLASSANYNLRFDGASSSEAMSIGALKVADVDGDGKLDILASTYDADNHGRTNSGSLYIVNNNLLTQYATSTGNNIDLASSTNWSIRIDGGAANDRLTFIDGLAISDMNGNSTNDLLIGARFATYNGSGTMYVIYDSILTPLASTTGNILDLASSTSWNIRYDDTTAGTQALGNGPILTPDLDNDGARDIVVSSYGSDHAPLDDQGDVLFIKNSLFSGYAGTGNIVNLATSTNFNIRYRNITGGHGFLGTAMATDDLNGDGLADLVMAAPIAENGGDKSKGAGWVYVLYNDLVNSYAGTGNVVDLDPTAPSSYNVRFEGAFVDHNLGDGVNTADMDMDGRTDLILSTASPEEITNDDTTGAAYVIYNPVFSALTGTGNDITVSSSTYYSVRYQGPNGLYFSQFPISRDLTSDGRPDLILPARGSNNNSRISSGSVYLFYNFPHTLSKDTLFTSLASSTFVVSGTVSATGSVTAATAVQYNVDSNIATSTWIDCTLASGTFQCSASDLANGAHTIYFRAKDANNAYTATSSYGSHAVTIGTSSISNITLAAAGTTATTTWTTSEAGSSQLLYNRTANSLTTTATTTETDTSPRTTSHTVTLTNLDTCTEYTIYPISRDAANNLTQGTGQSFTSSGCPVTSPGGGGGGGSGSRRNSVLPTAPTLPLTESPLPSSRTIVPAAGPLPRRLTLGANGGDVMTLQKFLNANGFSLASDGPGSPGQETTFFGPRTRAALVSFQNFYRADILTPLGLSQGTGYFGPATMGFIARLQRP